MCRLLLPFIHKSKGQAITELALILPFLLIIVGGIIDFGLALFAGHVIENAAREGARAGAVVPPSGGVFPSAAATTGGLTCQINTNCAGNTSVILDTAYDALAPGGNLMSGMLNDFEITSKFIPTAPNEDAVEVEITGTNTYIFLRLIGLNSIELKRSARMRWEWQDPD